MEVPGGDLAAKFATLGEQHQAAIGQCRQLLHRFEDSTVAERPGPLQPADAGNDGGKGRLVERKSP